MKLRMIFVTLCAICLVGCSNTGISQSEYDAVVQERDNYKKLYEDLLLAQTEKVSSEAETEEDYDYRTDPNTLTVVLTQENISDYIGLIVRENSDGKYSVFTSSVLYDQGYVLVGDYYVSIEFSYVWIDENGEIHESENGFSTTLAFAMEVASGFDSYDQAKEYADYGIGYFKPRLEYTDSTMYFQKEDYLGDNYLMEEGRRIVYGNEWRNSDFHLDNKF